MPLELPNLPYAFDALEPHFDARTMEIHHGKHHAAYVAKGNAALKGTDWADKSAQDVISNLSNLPDSILSAARNNAGGHVNHAMFWQCLAPAGNGGGGAPSGDLAAAIDSGFGSFDAFKEKFATAGMTRFGSGWAWLMVTGNGLAVGSTANQDNPIMGESVAGVSGTPILGLDVWEHAYYLNYQNRRPDYIAAFWEIVNWSYVAELFAKAQ